MYHNLNEIVKWHIHVYRILWMSLDFYGFLGTSKYFYGLLWIFYGLLWTSMVICGHLKHFKMFLMSLQEALFLLRLSVRKGYFLLPESFLFTSTASSENQPSSSFESSSKEVQNIFKKYYYLKIKGYLIKTYIAGKRSTNFASSPSLMTDKLAAIVNVIYRIINCA